MKSHWRRAFFLHNSKYTKHIHATRVQNTTLYSDVTTHNKQRRSKVFNQMATPARTITIALDMSKAFDTLNIHTLIRILLQTKIQEETKQSKNNKSQDPDKLNIRHLRHIGPLGLAFRTSMLKTAINTNIIPHIWKLTNISPIPKPNKDIDKSISIFSYMSISLLSVIAKTLEIESLITLQYKTLYFQLYIYVYICVCVLCGGNPGEIRDTA